MRHAEGRTGLGACMLGRVMALVLVLAGGTALCAPNTVRAEVKTLTAEHVYVMGDNDTRTEARRICFMQAKRKLVEQVGTYVEVLTEMSDFRLTRDEVRSFTAATMQVEVDEETFFMKDKSFAVRMKVRARVDGDAMRERLQTAARQRDDLVRMRERYDTTRRLEDKALAVQERLRTAPPEQAAPLRQERDAILGTLEETQARYDAIMQNRKTQAHYAERFVEADMTRSEVRSLLGEPRTIRRNGDSATFECWNYGRVWVVFRDGLVVCRRESLSYSQRHGGDCHCSGFVGTGGVFMQ